MKCVVFLGPTLGVDEARSVLPATYLPPAAQGDVYRAALGGPFAIGLVDGFFERLPAVWHKEILWALTRGVHVFGAASMGALRAAELADYGMRGVGKIYDDLRSGAIEDDDEVAIAHGDASTRYRALSEAMVNIRATLRAAAVAGALLPASQQVIERLAKASFYPDRSYPQLLAMARSEGVPEPELRAFSEFVKTGMIDQKREDAIALLHAMKSALDTGAPAERPAFYLSPTAAWVHVLTSAVEGSSPGPR